MARPPSSITEPNKGKEQKNKNNDTYQQIGQLKVERELLEERSGP